MVIGCVIDVVVQVGELTVRVTLNEAVLPP